MRPEREILGDLLAACDAVADFIEDIDEAAFRDDDLVRSAVLAKLLLIGEAASQLGRRFHEEHPGPPWPDVVGMRNVLIHGYFRVNWERVWVTASVEVPRLREQVEGVLEGLD